jgi:hypothetical protein
MIPDSFRRYRRKLSAYAILLMSQCDKWAAGLGHELLYTERGSAAEQLCKQLGWQIIRDDHYDGIALSVMRKHLQQTRP